MTVIMCPTNRMKRRKEKQREKKMFRYNFIFFQNYLTSNYLKLTKLIKIISCFFFAQIQEATKLETKTVKMEKKKTKFVGLLDHGNVLLKGIHIIINMYK